jgi:hypothetical protein
MKTWSLPYT